MIFYEVTLISLQVNVEISGVKLFFCRIINEKSNIIINLKGFGQCTHLRI